MEIANDRIETMIAIPAVAIRALTLKVTGAPR